MQEDLNTSLVAASNLSMMKPEIHQYEVESYEKVRVRDYWTILLKRKYWVLGFFLGLLLMTIAVIALMDPIYKPSVALTITQENPDSSISSSIGGNGGVLFQPSPEDKFLATQLEILKSRSLGDRIINRLKLENYGEFKKIRDQVPTIWNLWNVFAKKKSPEELHSNMIDLFQDKTTIEPVKDTFLVNIAFKSTDKDMSQQVVNNIAQEYMALVIDARSQSYGIVKRWLEKELAKLETKLTQSEFNLYNYGKNHDFNLFLQDKDNVLVQKFVILNDLLTKASADRMSKESQYRQIKENGLDAPPITNNPLIQNLRHEMATLQSKVAGTGKIVKDAHPQMKSDSAQVKELRAKLAQEVTRIRTSVEADYNAARKAENLLLEAHSQQKARVANLEQKAVKYNILKRDADTNGQLYKGLLERLKAASVAATQTSSNVQVIDPAGVPFKPWLPKPLIFVSVAGILGLLGGVGLALTVEHFDDSIKTTEELERTCRIPTLGIIPRYSQNGNKHSNLEKQCDVRLVSFQRPTCLVSEAIRNVHASVMLSAPGGPPESIMITSPNPSEGKTVLSINLGISLAMQGRSVAIIDMDLRKPSLHVAFEKSVQPGLSNYLTGNASKEEIIESTEIPNLTIIPAGTVPPNPTDLLVSRTLKDFVEELRGRFQHLIIDTPPLLGFADARLISPLADGVMLIIKHHSTPRETGRLARHLLMQMNTRVIGAVLNQVSIDRPGYGSYYYRYYTKEYHQYESITN